MSQILINVRYKKDVDEITQSVNKGWDVNRIETAIHPFEYSNYQVLGIMRIHPRLSEEEAKDIARHCSRFGSLVSLMTEVDQLVKQLYPDKLCLTNPRL